MVSTSAGTATWESWMTTTSSDATGTTADVWVDWCGSTGTLTTTSTATGETAWTGWITHDQVRRSDLRPVFTQAREPSKEARKAAKRAERLRVLKHRLATRRARQLLQANLNKDQRKQFKKHGWFFVDGNKSRYRVKKGRVANVEVLEANNTVKHRLCAHPGASVPDFDTMLAQKLMLENQEDEFLRLANIH